MSSEEKKELIYNFILVLVIAVCVAVVVTFNVTYNKYVAEGLIIEKSDISDEGTSNINGISATLKNFRRIIDKYYIGEIDETKIMDETIKGYINGLDDEYSEYMTKEEWAEFEASALGNYVGIGVTISQDANGNVVVVNTIADAPAEAAGLKAEDVFVEVNGESVLGFTTNDVARKIQGEEGTKVKVKVARGNEYLDFEMERKAIKVYHVEGEVKDGNIGYILLQTFDEGAAEEFIEKYNELKNKGAKKLIIDLRYNTGGLLEECVSIADYMLDKDDVILTAIDAEGREESYKSENVEKPIDTDIVVLVNDYSASASEVLAGALKDNGEATIVGEKTYGKGVIQNVFTLADGSKLKLTISEYLTPSGTRINKIGIMPDVEVFIDPEVKENDEIVDSQLNKAIEILKGESK